MMNNELSHLAVKSQVESCLLCHNAPCTKACPNEVVPDVMIRSLRFDNPHGAKKALLAKDVCYFCEEAFCMEACIKAHIDSPVDIPMIAAYVDKEIEAAAQESSVDLSIEFCGVPCENPFFLSSSVAA